MISFNGVLGHGSPTEYCSPALREWLCGYQVRAERLAAKAAFSGERYEDIPEGLSRKPLSFGEDFSGHGRRPCRSSLPSFSKQGLYRHQNKFASLFSRASASEENMHASGSAEFFPKAASLGKDNKKVRKQKKVRDNVKEKESRWEFCNEEKLSAEAETSSLKSDAVVGELQETDSSSGSWTDDEKHSLASRYFPKVASSEKDRKKVRKQKKVRDDVKEKESLWEFCNDEKLPAEAETALLKSDAVTGELQEIDSSSGSWTDDEKHSLASTVNKLEALHLHALALEQWHGSSLINVHRKYQKSARNLLHYMAMKSVDLQEVRKSLPMLGLATLEGIEGHVVASLSQSIRAARTLLMSLASDMDVRIDDNLGKRLFWKDEKQFNNNIIIGADAHNKTVGINSLPPLSAGRNEFQLNHSTVALFGPRSSQRQTYVMVTLSEEMLENETLILDLMKAGMDVVRINCAHGNPEVWGRMIQTVKHCSQMLEQPCRVLMDLAGPKLRTSAFPPGPCVLKIRPQRDGLGNTVQPARVWIALPGTPVPEGASVDAVVPVTGDIWLGSLQVGDKLVVQDGRRKLRELIIIDKIMGSNGIGCWAECFQTIFLESGTKLKLSNKKGKMSKGYVADLPPLEQFIRLKKGDVIVLTKESSFQDASESDVNESWIYRVQVSHTFGQLFESVKPGEHIRFDDGRIEGVIRGATSSEVCVEVTFANEKGTKLGGEKSINLPNSSLSQKGLTVKDMIDLDFVIGHADMVALSFVNSSQDVQALQKALKGKGATSIGVVLKIETKSGVMNLSEILLQAMKNGNPLGVMIARGDLAVECGWENMAEVQEEVLRVCKAAHIPTIWATQVLESLTKQGLPTRPEITDAALGGRSACVMLNKGSHILKAVSVLSRILDNSVSQRWEVHSHNQPFDISSLND